MKKIVDEHRRARMKQTRKGKPSYDPKIVRTIKQAEDTPKKEFPDLDSLFRHLGI